MEQGAVSGGEVAVGCKRGRGLEGEDPDPCGPLPALDCASRDAEFSRDDCGVGAGTEPDPDRLGGLPLVGMTP